MVQISPIPRRTRAPKWFDLRLLVGVFLVLGSVAVGAIVMSRGNSTRPVLAVGHDLSAGTVLTDGDLRTVRVRIDGAVAVYFEAGSDVSGKVLRHDVTTGELLAVGSVAVAGPDETSLTVPVKPENAPELERGQRVAIWVSTQHCQAVPVLSDVAVQAVREAGSGALSAASSESLVIRVSRPLAQRVVTALGLDGATIRVGVVTGSVDDDGASSLPDLSVCAGPDSK
ncbi:MAG: uncharacterized protein JWM76_2100 [Pseudonocardiales bacterium]|nr:uncharacterized protein [Pseudonocardiales bacterium]